MSEAKQLTFALDYDETYTADRDLWDCFIGHAQQRGHRVIGVTCRRRTEENLAEVQMPVPVYYTDLGSKRHHMERLGVKVDIWIDDDPKCVEFGK